MPAADQIAREDDLDHLVAQIDGAIAAALAAPRRDPTRAEIAASVDRMMAPLARRYGLVFAPLSVELPANDPTPEIAEPGDLQADAPAVRDLVKKRDTRRPRRSGSRDQKDAKVARAYRRSLWEAKGGAKTGPLHQHTSSTSSSLRPLGESPRETTETPTIEALRPDNDNRGMASWKDAGDLTRITYINEALDGFGVPYAFSVNLGPEVIQGANDNARGFLDYVKRRLSRELAKAMRREPTFWVVIETTGAKKPHVHGGIAINDNDIPAVERALERAGGRWRRLGTDRQIDLAPIRHNDTWAAYPFKRQGRTRRHLRELAGLPPDARVAILSATNDLRAEGERRHAAERKKINQR